MKRFSLTHGLVVVFLVGCSSDGSLLESTETLREGFGQSCGAATPVATFSRTISYTTPSRIYTQTSCGKGVVVGVTNYATPPACSSGGGGFGGGGGVGKGGDVGMGGAPLCSGAQTKVAWADVAAKTQQGCENMYADGLLFSGLGSGATFITGKSAYGTWVNGQCIQPSISFNTSEMAPGGSYKVAATARFGPTWTQTAVVSIKTTY